MNEDVVNEKLENVVEENEKDLEKQKTLDERLSKANELPYIVSARKLLEEPDDEYDCLWEPFISREEIVCLSGGSDIGKSSLLRQLAIAIVKKEDTFLNHPLNVKNGSVLYVSIEDGKRGTKKTLKTQLCDEDPKIFEGLRFLFDTKHLEKRINEQLKMFPADVVIIDAFTNAFKGNINDIISVKTFLEKYKEICEENNCVVIFLHHNGKRTELNGANKNNIIGSTGFEGTMRTCLELRKGDNDKRYLWITKGNYIPDNLKKQGLELSFDDKQVFVYSGKTVCQSLSGGKKKFLDEEKTAIIDKAVLLQKDGLSLDKILVKLKEETETLPGKTLLAEWIKKEKTESTTDDSKQAA